MQLNFSPFPRERELENLPPAKAPSVPFVKSADGKGACAVTTLVNSDL